MLLEIRHTRTTCQSRIYLCRAVHLLTIKISCPLLTKQIQIATLICIKEVYPWHCLPWYSHVRKEDPSILHMPYKYRLVWGSLHLTHDIHMQTSMRVPPSYTGHIHVCLYEDPSILHMTYKCRLVWGSLHLTQDIYMQTSMRVPPSYTWHIHTGWYEGPSILHRTYTCRLVWRSLHLTQDIYIQAGIRVPPSYTGHIHSD